MIFLLKCSKIYFISIAIVYFIKSLICNVLIHYINNLIKAADVFPLS